jgi:hypothetical protein
MIKLIPLLEVKIANPNRLTKQFIENNIHDLIIDDESGNELDYDQNEGVVEIVGWEGFPIYIVRDKDGCNSLTFFDAEYDFSDYGEWEGPVSLPEEDSYKGVKYKVYWSGC